MVQKGSVALGFLHCRHSHLPALDLLCLIGNHVGVFVVQPCHRCRLLGYDFVALWANSTGDDYYCTFHLLLLRASAFGPNLPFANASYSSILFLQHEFGHALMTKYLGNK